MKVRRIKMSSLKAGPKWELFEKEACDYLNYMYRGKPITFEASGGKNAFTSDIKAYIGDEYLFSIESKYSPAQSGQFVIIEEENEYKLSTLGYSNNKYTQEIINHLNSNKNYYTPRGQSSINIDIDKSILSSWIVEHYKSKDSYFVITSTKLNDYKVILPTEEIHQYFDVSAVIRRKRSGTGNVAKSKVNDCISKLKDHLYENNIGLKKINSINNKTIVELDGNNELEKSLRYFGEVYYLSPTPQEPNKFTLKSRAKTNNINVIFSLKFTGKQVDFGIDLLDKYVSKFYV